MNNQNGATAVEDLMKTEYDQVNDSYIPPKEYLDSVGITAFDVPNSKDNFIRVLVSEENLSKLPSQSLVKIGHENLNDGRVYQGIVVEGPFYEPDGMKADSSVIVTTAVNGVMFMPNYHGRVSIEIMGEIKNGRIIPPRFRPLPNSPVYALGNEATAKALKVDGEIRLGTVIGMENIEVNIPNKKNVLARHIGILGTTGGGKSTTVSGLVGKFQEQGIATILIDTEGEYTDIFRATRDKDMLNLIELNELSIKELEKVTVYKLKGKESSCSDDNRVKEFG